MLYTHLGEGITRIAYLRQQGHLELALHLANCERLVQPVTACQQQHLQGVNHLSTRIGNVAGLIV